MPFGCYLVVSTTQKQTKHTHKQTNKNAQYVDRRYATPATTIYPTKEAGELEDRFHDYVGPHTRRVAYYHLLQDRDTLLEVCRRNSGPTQTRLVDLAWPLFERAYTCRDCRAAVQTPKSHAPHETQSTSTPAATTTNSKCRQHTAAGNIARPRCQVGDVYTERV